MQCREYLLKNADDDVETPVKHTLACIVAQ